MDREVAVKSNFKRNQRDHAPFREYNYPRTSNLHTDPRLVHERES